MALTLSVRNHHLCSDAHVLPFPLVELPISKKAGSPLSYIFLVRLLVAVGLVLGWCCVNVLWEGLIQG